jgi:DnaK suppressor protein
VENHVNVELYRQRLLALERELSGRLVREVETARDERDDQSSPGDLAHVDELKDEFYAMADADSAILAQIRAALQRIDDETFGMCVVDGRPIEEKRLQAVPWTPYCLEHQEALEKQRRLRTPTL